MSEETLAFNLRPNITPIRFNFSLRAIFAGLFSSIFFGLSAAMVVSMLYVVVDDIMNGVEIMQVMIKIINTGIIALAVFELAMVISKEYGSANEDHDVAVMLKRTLPRFIGTVCIALSLEALIMVIKYSQLELAGNLYYPVAIIVSTALLLAALGVFLKLATNDSNGNRILPVSCYEDINKVKKISN